MRGFPGFVSRHRPAPPLSDAHHNLTRLLGTRAPRRQRSGGRAFGAVPSRRRSFPPTLGPQPHAPHTRTAKRTDGPRSGAAWRIRALHDGAQPSPFRPRPASPRWFVARASRDTFGWSDAKGGARSWTTAWWRSVRPG